MHVKVHFLHGRKDVKTNMSKNIYHTYYKCKTRLKISRELLKKVLVRLLCYINNSKINSSPKNENCHRLLALSSRSTPVWVSFFCWTQNNIFWRYFEVNKELMVFIDWFSILEKKMEVRGTIKCMVGSHGSS